jgi:hypothetical protein
MQIIKGCSIEFLSARFWQLVYKENIRCTRLMRRSLQVVIPTTQLMRLDSAPSKCSTFSASRDVSATKSIKIQVCSRQ